MAKKHEKSPLILNPRARATVCGIVEGKGVKQAALDAGYSESYSTKVARRHPEIIQAVRNTLEANGATPEKAARVVAKALDAKTVDKAGAEHEDFRTSLMAADRVLALNDIDPRGQRQPVQVNTQVNVSIVSDAAGTARERLRAILDGPAPAPDKGEVS